MDDDDLRRGVPTNHKVFGEAMAILAGDWLATHAFTLLVATPDARAVPQLSAALAAGTDAMIVGQAADIEGENQPTNAEQVKLIHRHKTAALIEACCKMGAIAAGADARTVDGMASYGRHLGLAFQIADDLLDATATTEELGKRAGKDADASKQTYPAAFGVEESRRQARAEVDQAVAALSPFGVEAEHLRALAEYVITREK
jgi:geranylgeranyl diphosphate synthase type II